MLPRATAGRRNWPRAGRGLKYRNLLSATYDKMQMTRPRNRFPVRASFWRRHLPLSCGLILLPGALLAGNSPQDQERAALSSARALFDDFQYRQAEASLARFLAAY